MPRKPSDLSTIERAELLARIQARVNRNGPIPPNPSRPVDTRCWIWVGGTMPAGYGSISIDDHTYTVHRLYYELTVGPIPEGHDIDHYCRVRRCLRHIEPVTRLENIIRGQQLPTCKNGHPMTGNNIGPVKGHPARRVCRACARDRVRRYQSRKAAAHA